jgi:predicted dehydrogenase
MQTGVAFIGCGYVADYYVDSIKLHRQLRLVGAYDRDAARNERFNSFHGIQRYRELDELLADPRVDIVVNLTTPECHREVTVAALSAGKHVYSEKPIALSAGEMDQIAEAARRSGRQFAAAPCCVLSDAAQTLWKAVRDGRVGRANMAFAEVDDGLLHRAPYEKWISRSGAPWSAAAEMSHGCVRAHAPYPVSWLAMMFGPVREVVAYSTRRVNGEAIKHNGNGNGSSLPLGPDLGMATLVFANGFVARLTCTVLAPRNRSITVFGDEGVVTLSDSSRDRSPVRLRRYFQFQRRLMLSPWARTCPMLRSGTEPVKYRGAQRRDFARGIAEMADAIAAGRPPRLSLDFCRHVTEVVLAIHDAGGQGVARRIESTFDPIRPMPWAQ